MHISTTFAVLLVLAAPLSLSAQTGTPSDGTMAGTTGGESFTGLFRVKHTMNTKIPPGHPTISPRPSATLSGTCTSADYVNDLKIGVRLYNAPANAFANIKTSQEWAYPVVQAKSSDPIRVIARASGSTGARRDAQWKNIMEKKWNEIRIPVGARPSTGSDGTFAVIDPTRSYVTEFYRMTTTDGVRFSADWLRRYSLDEVPYIQPPDGLGGSGLCPMAKTAGIVRYHEIVVDDLIPHAMSVSYNYPAAKLNNNPNNIFPCEADAENYGNRRCSLLNGMRLQYDPAADPAIECADVPAPYRGSCRVIVKALQDYGMVIVDGGGGLGIYGENVSFYDPRDWMDGAAEGYALPKGGWSALQGVDFDKLRVIEPIKP